MSTLAWIVVATLACGIGAALLAALRDDAREARK